MTVGVYSFMINGLPLYQTLTESVPTHSWVYHWASTQSILQL